MNHFDYSTPKSMNQARAWSPEGKLVKTSSETHGWSYKPKKVRLSEPKKWKSKNQEYVKCVYAKLLDKTL